MLAAGTAEGETSAIEKSRADQLEFIASVSCPVATSREVGMVHSRALATYEQRKRT